MIKNDRTKLWESVCDTNPADTKKVSLGRTFTAIDPYSQIRKATEVFGPAGSGWGWTVIRVEYTQTNQVAVLVRLWHGENTHSIEQWGQAGMFIDNAEKKKDDDCFKKATTDGITKCLSYLGFNADVFLGKFDGNKYTDKDQASVAVKRMIEMTNALKENWRSVCAIKEGIAADDLLMAVEAMEELPNETKSALNIAPTKGGVFTTQEVKTMKSNEWAAALKEMTG